MRKRYPDWDPRSWSEPFQDPPTEPRRPAVTGQWVQDPRERSGWRWDTAAPAGDESPTWIGPSPVAAQHELGTPRREPAMSQDPIPSSPHVYDPSIGADGGGQHIDPEQVSFEQPAGFERPGWGTDVVGEAPVCCPTCGSGVHPDRLC